MSSDVNKRLTIAREQLGLKRRDFAKSLGVSHGTIDNWEAGKTAPTVEWLNTIEQIHKISANWLLTGNGEMSTSNARKSMDIPLIPLRLSGQDSDNEPMAISTLTFDEGWIQKRIGTDPRHLFLVEVEGDGMTPTLNPGDLIMVDRAAAGGGFMDGLWVFKIENAVHLKRVQQVGPNQFQAISDNAIYKPVALGKSARLIGRVIWSEKRW
jgi:phage repressor protein C with HTH and peptisase S24 domain